MANIDYLMSTGDSGHRVGRGTASRLVSYIQQHSNDSLTALFRFLHSSNYWGGVLHEKIMELAYISQTEGRWQEVISDPPIS